MCHALKFYFSPKYTVTRGGKVNITGTLFGGKFFYVDEYQVWDLLSRSKMIANVYTEITGFTPDAEIFELTDD